ncbi:MAG: hypothetical protein QW645_00740, partial [Candidatus Bathyarchaeia archaeon]
MAHSIPVVDAAPSGSIGAPSGSVADNVLVLGQTEQVTITFRNTAGAGVGDVASTIQYIALAAANLNPMRARIDPLTASWEIYRPDNTMRASGTVVGSREANAIYSPHSTTQGVYLYVWRIGPPSDDLDAYTDPSQFNDALRVLRPGESIRLTITVKCENEFGQSLVGDSVFWFFFRATEAHYGAGNYPDSIDDIPSEHRMNLYYSNGFWLPLHNSYDPYDPDINTGHNFGQNSWTRGPTKNAFAKANKMVHQKPPEDPPALKYSFHICGIKFHDVNGNGKYDVDIEGVGIEPGINGIEVVLLGADGKTKAEEYYPGAFTYPSPEGNPLLTGENDLPGAYCFNMENVNGGKTYIFYVKLIEKQGWSATTPTIVGPIILEADADGPHERLDIHFGNVPTAPPPP